VRPMLTKIQLELDRTDIHFQKASNLQGVLMKAAGSDFATEMHEEGQHSYSQFVSNKHGKTIWTVNALNTNTSEFLTDVLMSSEFDHFWLRYGRKGTKEVHVLNKEIIELSDQELIDEFQQKKSKDSFRIAFLTPTAFKQQGKYVVIPDPRLIFQSLITKCNTVTDQGNAMEADQDLLDEIADMITITKYNLHTERYPFERTWAPGFVGTLDFRIQGEEMVKRYIRFLLRFGEYAGVGIKTGMGMGGFAILS